MEEMQVISLTEDKVWRTEYDNSRAYAKKTKESEVNNIQKASEFLKGKSIVINGEIYQVNVPEIYSWDGRCLIMEECIGENLELMLRDEPKREAGKNALNSVMNFCLKEHFYWHDLAPRNMIINGHDQTISLVDFERGVTLDRNFNQRQYLRENVFEEYVAFLLPEERPIKADKVFELQKEENNPFIDVRNVKSNRVKKLAKKLNLPDNILYSQYLKLISMLIKAEEPLRKDGKVIFPIVELEEILAKDGYDAYISEVYKRNNLRERGVER